MSYPYSVQVFFDPSTEARIKHVWADVVQKSGLVNHLEEIIGVRPHISFGSFGSFGEENKEQVLACVKRLAAEQPPFEFNFAAIGIFDGNRGIPYFAPAITKEMLDFQIKCHEALLKICLKSDDRYRPGKIVFHCSVNIGLSKPELLQAAAVMLETPLPILVRIESIALLTATPESFTYSFALGDKIAVPPAKHLIHAKSKR